MPIFIGNVADVWQESNHIVVVSDVLDTQVDFRHGDLIELRHPDGTVLQARGNLILFDPPADRPFAVVFTELSRKEVPIGAQLWFVNEREPRKPSRHYEVTKRANATATGE